MSCTKKIIIDLDILIRDNKSSKLISAEIVSVNENDFPIISDAWSFNWLKTFRQKTSKVYMLRVKDSNGNPEGFIQLSEIEGMLFMNLIELAPHNIGKTDKRYDFVAGCLISFACYKSFHLKSNYAGFLSFETKTKLKEWYKEKYFAQSAIGNKMFIMPNDGVKLIDKYLYHKH